MFPLDAEALEHAERAVADTDREYARSDDPQSRDRAVAENCVTAYLIAWLSKRALEELLGEDPQTARTARRAA